MGCADTRWDNGITNGTAIRVQVLEGLELVLQTVMIVPCCSTAGSELSDFPPSLLAALDGAQMCGDGIKLFWR